MPTHALAGGKVRAGAANAYIGIHQIINGSNRPETGRRNLDALSTKADPALLLSQIFIGV
jgi:hypothetical protein